MKKIVLMTLIMAALVLGLVSCDDGSGGGSGKYNFAGHYDVYCWNNSLKGNEGEDKDVTLRNWLAGGFSKYEVLSKGDVVSVFFAGDKWDLLTNDKSTASGTFSYYDDEHIVWNQDGYAGTEKFTVVEKDTIFFHLIFDDPSGISNGWSYFTGTIFKKSGRKGHIEVKNQAYWFVDD